MYLQNPFVENISTISKRHFHYKTFIVTKSLIVFLRYKLQISYSPFLKLQKEKTPKTKTINKKNNEQNKINSMIVY